MTPAPADGLLHPLPLLAIAVLVLNDHVLKAAFPGAITGKLSDFAGLVFFPLLLQGVWELGAAAAGRRCAPSRRVLVGAAIATAVVFAAVQIWGPAGDLYRHGLAALQWPFRAASAAASGHPLPAVGAVRLLADPTDLIALPCVGLAVAVGWPRCGQDRGIQQE